MSKLKMADSPTVGSSTGRSSLTLSRGSGITLPPGPPVPSPLQAAAWALRPLQLMERCERRYGEIFTLRVRRNRPWVFLTNPEHIKKVFTAAPEAVSPGASEANPLLGPLLGPSSVMLLDEPAHMQDRRRLLPSFHGDRMRSYGDMMSRVARAEIQHWPLGEPFALWPRMQAISLEVVMRGVFGDVSSPRFEELRRRLVEMTAWVNHPRRLALLAALGQRSLTRNKHFYEVMRPVEEIVLDEVHERRQAGGSSEEQEGILSMLERAYSEDGGSMSEEKLRDELVTLLSDGPTATSLAWVFERLLQHPNKLARLRAEVQNGEGEEYLDAVVKETLRLCPTVPVVMRGLVEPMSIGGYTIPAGGVVAPCVYLTHLRSDIYSNPHEFMPERFLEDPVGTYTWIPFGGGPRRCVAASFAPLEMRRVIQAVLTEVDLRPATAGSAAPTRSSVSFAPQGGAMVIATRAAAATARDLSIPPV
jgi:cytochrome P450 family 135